METTVINDILKLKEMQPNPMSLEGVVICRDAFSGEILFTRKNIIVRRGRTFALQRIFGKDALNGDVVGYSTESIAEKRVCLFGIGKGGAVLANPFQPLQPTADDLALYSPIPINEASNIVDALKPNYIQIGAGEDILYKVFDNDASMETYVNETNNESYVKITMTIESSDILRGDDTKNKINELGLYSAELSEIVADNFRTATSDIVEMFSHVTFSTEELTGAKSLKFDYYVYA